MASKLGRSVRAFVARWQQPLIFASAAGLFSLLTLLPLLWPLLELAQHGLAALRESLEVLGTARPWALLVRSLALSLAVVAVAVLLGTPMGLFLARTDVWGRRVLLFVHAFPMFLPPFILALGWFSLLGRNGIAGSELSASWLFHPLGHVGVLSLVFAPIVTVLVVLGLWNLDPSLEEAARVVATPFRVAVGIVLPAIWPAIALASIVVFALAFSELGVPLFLRVDVYPAALFARLGGIEYEPGEAFLLALPLLPVVLGLLALERWLFRRRPFDVLGLRYRRRAPLALGAWRPGVSALGWLLALVALLPLVALTLQAASGGGLGELWNWVGNSVLTSLLASAVAATAIVGLGAILGHGCARGSFAARWLDFVGVVALVVPAVLLGVGLIGVWNRPGAFFLYGSVGILIVGYVARYGILGIRTMAVAVAQSPQSLEDAASVFGASYVRRLASIVLPLNRRALIGAWLLAVVFCLRDLETAVIYYPPGKEPLTVRLFTLEANGPQAVVAGLAMLEVAVTASVVCALGGLLWRHERVRA